MSTLVALHGFTGCSESFQLLIRALARPRTKVYAPNLAGHRAAIPSEENKSGTDGLRVPSSGTRHFGPMRFVGQVDALAQSIIRAKMTGAHLLGYSLGGRMALGLLARHPHLFCGATIVSANPGLHSATDRVQRSIADARWCQLLSRSLPTFLERWNSQPLFQSQNQAPSESLALQQRIRAAQTAHGLALSLKTAGLGQMPNFWSVAESYRGPLTVVAGALDSKFMKLGQAFALRATAAAARRPVRFVALPNCGHNLVVEAPEALADVLRPSL